jgi:hypothetical protein
MTESLFSSAHEALVFAFRYAHDQSPRTPMTSLMQGGPIGSGKGLTGVDGAAQAGMILAALPRVLTAEQRNVVTVRYGDVRHDCPCCRQPAPTSDWAAALDALSHCEELGDLPRAIRHAAVERIVCRRNRHSMAHWANAYDMSERTLRERSAKAKLRLAKVEAAALAEVYAHLEGRMVLEAA